MAQPTPTPMESQIQRDGRIALRMMRLICRPDMPDGIEIDPDRPSIACGNHQSLLDVFLAAAFCHSTGVSCRFLVNARYFDQRLIGRWLRRIGCIPLDRDTKEEAFAVAIAGLRRGELIGIMPEGRLTPPAERDPQVGPLRPGVAELGVEANAWLRPIIFHNSGLAWPRGKWPKVRVRRPKVTMRLGDVHIDPHRPSDQVIDELTAALTAMLDDADATWGRTG